MKPWHSIYLYGMHEPCPPDVLPPGRGWFLHLVEVGDNPEPHPGLDLTQYVDYGNIARLQYSWGGGGTFPPPQRVDAYVARVRSLVANSPDCHVWIVGNEPNHPAEVGEDGQMYSPDYAAAVYSLVHSTVHALPGHAEDEVLLPPVAPWIDLIGMDWIEYFQELIRYAPEIDGFALHTYSRGPLPQSITDDTRMDAPYSHLRNGFQTYKDWLRAIPMVLRDLPCYITETDQLEPWSMFRTSWVQAMYAEINRHNEDDGQVIRCALLYRWPHYDQWGIEGNGALIADFRAAQGVGYKWTDDEPQEDEMLLNPSFEDGWHEQGAGELVLPDGWSLEYRDGDHPWCGPNGKRPEVKPNQEYVTQGRFSIRAFPPAHSRGVFGIWQDVEVEAGQWYTFTAQARIESNPPGEMAAYVGIQPWGAGLFERQMVWGKETQVIGEWQTVSVTAQAFGSRVRVAMGANNKWATQNNTVWWDNAHLEPWECTTEPEPPEPPEPPEQPIGCCWEEAKARAIIREELDRTVWASGVD